MPHAGARPWTLDDDNQLRTLRDKKVPWMYISDKIGRTISSVQNRYDLLRKMATHADELSDPECAYARVPQDDPLLARLKLVHGKDTVNRNIVFVLERL